MQNIKLAVNASKNQEGIKAVNKRELPQAFVNKAREIIEKRDAIFAHYRENEEAIESNDSGSDTPGGQSIKILNDDVIIAKLAAATEYFTTIEDPSDEEKSILTEISSVATLLAAGDVITNPLQKVTEVLQRAEALKMAATGKVLEIDKNICSKQIADFVDKGPKTNLTMKDVEEATKKFLKKPSPELKQ
jgi:hypothetical protein